VNRKISFQIQTIDGHSLAVDLFLPEIPGTEKLSTLVYCHGFKGFKDWGFVPYIEQFLVTEKLALITFNYSHNGVIAKDFDDLASFADNTIGQELRDMESLALWIVNEGVELYGFNPESISWLGHSRGGGNVLVFANLFPDYVKKLVTWAAIDSYENLFQSINKNDWKKNNMVFIENSRTKQQMPLKYFIWQDYLDNKQKYDIISAAHSLTKPLLVCHGKQDESVGYSAAEKIYKACAHSILYTVENGNHTFGVSHPINGLQDVNKDFWMLLDNTLSFIEDEEI